MNTNTIPGYCNGWSLRGHITEDAMTYLPHKNIQLCQECYAEYNRDTQMAQIVETSQVRDEPETDFPLEGI